MLRKRETPLSNNAFHSNATEQTEMAILVWKKCYLNKKEKVKIYLPFKDDGKIDEDYIEYLVKKRRAWQTLLHLFPR